MSPGKIVVALASLFLVVPIAIVAYVETQVSGERNSTAANQAAAAARVQATARAYNSALATAAGSGPLTQTDMVDLERGRGVGFSAVRVHGPTTTVTFEILAPYSTALGEGGGEDECFQSTLTTMPTGRPVSALSEIRCSQLLPVPAPVVSKSADSS